VLAGFRGNGRFLFGYIGQLIPRKGLVTLLQAFSALRQQRAHLMLVGEGEQQAELVQLARQLEIDDRTHFVGYRPDRLDLLKCFDAFVLPSTLEGIPRCILESMAARVPVIVSDIPGSTDVVTDGLTGMTFPVGSPVELTDRMARVMHSPDEAASMAAAAEQRVREGYSAQAMATAYARLYLDLASGAAADVARSNS
jgi:glycosyltransferase involved in cell wall biosynthesis